MQVDLIKHDKKEEKQIESNGKKINDKENELWLEEYDEVKFNIIILHWKMKQTNKQKILYIYETNKQKN